MNSEKNQYLLAVLRALIDARAGETPFHLGEAAAQDLEALGFYDRRTHSITTSGERFVEQETYNSLLRKYDRVSLSQMLVTLEKYPGFRMTFPEELEWEFGDAGLWSLEKDQLTEKGRQFIQTSSK